MPVWEPRDCAGISDVESIDPNADKAEPVPPTPQTEVTAELNLQSTPSPDPPVPARTDDATEIEPEPDLQSDDLPQTEPQATVPVEQSAKPITPALSVLSANTRSITLIGLLIFLDFRGRT